MLSVIKDGREKSFKKTPNEMERIYLIIFMVRNGDTLHATIPRLNSICFGKDRDVL